MRIWQVMDECIHTGVSSQEKTLPGRLGVRRRAPMLYRRLMRGYVSTDRRHPVPILILNRFYPGIAMPQQQHLASIGPGAPTSSIASPETDDPAPASGSGLSNALPGRALRTPSRSPLVVGSFNHAVLPEPPVSKESPS